MKNRLFRHLYSHSRGSGLVPILIFMLVGLALAMNALQIGSDSLRSSHASTQRNDGFYTAEAAANAATSWLRSQSQNMTVPFRKDQFYSLFDRTAPSYGDNDTGTTKVLTRLKLHGSNNSIVLSNDSSVAASAFPTTSNISSGAAFNAANSFSGVSFAGAKVRITLVDAIPLDSTKDAPPLASANTDFYPIYRIDALTGTDRGQQVYQYVAGNLYYVDTIGFYGRDIADVRQDCTSAVFNGSIAGPSNAKCPVGSNSQINIQNTARIYGSGRSNGTVTPTSRVCANLSCSTGGTTCQGSSCAVPGLPVLTDWATMCAGKPNLGAYTVAANANRILVTPGCYTTVTINNKGSLTLQDTTQPYIFQALTIVGGNPATQLKIGPSPNSGTVRLYVDTITGNNINGNQAVNPSYKPSQFRIYYMGASDITLNGNATMAFALVSKLGAVTVQGNSTFYGGILAPKLYLTGSATVVYDEDLGGSVLNDLTYRVRQESQVYH